MPAFVATSHKPRSLSDITPKQGDNPDWHNHWLELMKDSHTIAATLNERLRDVRRGSLQIFGDWFGRPHDNIHTAVRAESTNDSLRIHFDEGETLDVWAPSDVEITAERFAIRGADKVRWEWFFYGREKTAKNRYFLEYERQGSQIKATTNVDWFTPQFDAKSEEPAVQIT